MARKWRASRIVPGRHSASSSRSGHTSQIDVETIRKPVLYLLAKFLWLLEKTLAFLSPAITCLQNFGQILILLLKIISLWSWIALKSLLADEGKLYYLCLGCATYSVGSFLGLFYLFFIEIVSKTISAKVSEVFGKLFAYSFLFLLSASQANFWWLTTSIFIAYGAQFIPYTESVLPVIIWLYSLYSCFLKKGFFGLAIGLVIGYTMAILPEGYFRNLLWWSVAQIWSKLRGVKVERIPPLKRNSGPQSEEEFMKDLETILKRIDENISKILRQKHDLEGSGDSDEDEEVEEENEENEEEGGEEGEERADFYGDRKESSSGVSTSGQNRTDFSPESEIERMIKCEDHYSILQLPYFQEIDEAVLKKEYRKKAVLVHPDKHGGKKEAAEAFQKLQSAYEFFQDKTKKKEYDSSLHKKLIIKNLFQRAEIIKEKKGIPLNALSGSCPKCGTNHFWTPVDRDPSTGRWCEECKEYHPVKNKDGWVEQKRELVFGTFSWLGKKRAFIMAQDKIYDATRWTECQGQKYPVNSHQAGFVLRNGANTLKLPSNHRELTSDEWYDYFAGALVNGYEIEDIFAAAYGEEKTKPEFRPEKSRKSRKQGKPPSTPKKSRKSRKTRF